MQQTSHQAEKEETIPSEFSSSVEIQAKLLYLLESKDHRKCDIDAFRCICKLRACHHAHIQFSSGICRKLLSVAYFKHTTLVLVHKSMMVAEDKLDQ